jgi:hypothetical protein
VPGWIDGIPVTWGQLTEAMRQSVTVDDAVFQEYQRSQWSGPQGQPLKLACTLTGPSHFANAKAVVRALRTKPFAVAWEPDGIYFNEEFAFIRATQVQARRVVGGTYLTIDAEYVGGPGTHSIGIVATARQRPNSWSLSGRTAIHVPGSAPRLVADWRFDEVEGNLGENLLTNPGFEVYTTSPGLPDGWTLNAGTATNFSASPFAYRGLQSVAVVDDGTANPQGIQQTPTITAGKSYLASIWFKRTTADGRPLLRIKNHTDSIDIDTRPIEMSSDPNYGVGQWALLQQTFYATAGKTYRYEFFNEATSPTGEVILFDEARLQEIVIRDYSRYGNDLVVGSQDPATNLQADYRGPLPGIPIPGTTRTGWRFLGNNGTFKQGAQTTASASDRTGLYDKRCESVTYEFLAHRNGLASGTGGYVMGKASGGSYTPRILLGTTTVEVDSRNSPDEYGNFNISFVNGETARFLVTYDRLTKQLRVYKKTLFPTPGTPALVASGTFDEWHNASGNTAQWLFGGPVTVSTYQAAAVDIGYARVWAGAMTERDALIYLSTEKPPAAGAVPGTGSQAITDARRGVIRSPSAFASLEATYQATGVLRNSTAPIEVTYQGGLGGIPDSYVRAYDASGAQIYGSGEALRDGVRIENTVMSLLLRPSANTVQVSDVTRRTFFPQDLTFAAHREWVSLGAGLSATPQRLLLQNTAGQRLEVLDTGNLIIDPANTTFKVPGAATRSLGTGLFYHTIRANTYLVGTTDFTVASDGTVAGSAGALYGLVWTTLTGTDRDNRLKEVFMEVLPSLVLQRRSR